MSQSFWSLYYNHPNYSQATKNVPLFRFSTFSFSIYLDLFRISDFGFRISRCVGLRVLATILAVAVASPVQAATNLLSADEIPPLIPPRGEIPPGFWDQHGSWVILGLVLLLVVASALVWFLTRPKPPPIITPAAIVAQQALEPLREQDENGVVLSRVSRIVRHYFSLSFGLPPAERTTTEFCGALAGVLQLSPQLSVAVADFLHKCDQRKFAPSQSELPLGAVLLAVKLIQEAERSRAASPKGGQGLPGPRHPP